MRRGGSPPTFRYAGGQWLAWDAYVEEPAQRASWSTVRGRGTYNVPKGRAVTAGAFSPSGRYVAYTGVDGGKATVHVLKLPE